MPELGLQVADPLPGPSGPIRFPSAGYARHFLDRLGFEKFMELEWEIEMWRNGKLKLSLGSSNGVATVKVTSEEGANGLMGLVSSYAGRVEPLQEPLAAVMLKSRPDGPC